ncbi:MAG: arylsulfatase [Balneolales bacterium]
MIPNTLKGAFLIFFLLMNSEFLAAQSQDNEPPNIIYILADDLGYGELGAYGQEKIETPNLDRLAEKGMKFTNHYSGSPVCAPSRYNLMTGKHAGHSYIRGNSEMNERGDVWSFEAMFENPELEGQRPIPPETVTVAELLKKAGYATGAIGKWGNGGPFTVGHPNNQGFDFFFGYLCQRQAHTYYPSHLWKNNQRILLDNDLVDPHQPLPEGLDPYDQESYTLFHDQPDYSPTLMHNEAINFIEENQNNPFFLYLPTPIPHVSVQAPQRWIDYYVNKFGEEEPYFLNEESTGNLHYVPVRNPNATYAAMISYLDEQVGDIVKKLQELGLSENTIIMFSSDNGPVEGYGVDPVYFDSASPFLGTSGWGKGTLHEGGIRVPMIVAWEGHIEPGSSTDHITAFWDIMPTLNELAGIASPEDIDGISFLPVLKGNELDQEQHEYLYWEYPGRGGQQAVRMGNWKALRKNIKSEGRLEIELYNLADDIREQHNIASEFPQIVNEVELIMKNARTVPELEEFKMSALGD